MLQIAELYELLALSKKTATKEIGLPISASDCRGKTAGAYKSLYLPLEGVSVHNMLEIQPRG